MSVLVTQIIREMTARHGSEIPDKLRKLSVWVQVYECKKSETSRDRIAEIVYEFQDPQDADMIQDFINVVKWNYHRTVENGGFTDVNGREYLKWALKNAVGVRWEDA